MRLFEIVRYAEIFVGRNQIDQMVGPPSSLVCGRFCGADIHFPINRDGIERQNLAIEAFGDRNSHFAFTGRSGAGQNDGIFHEWRENAESICGDRIGGQRDTAGKVGSDYGSESRLGKWGPKASPRGARGFSPLGTSRPANFDLLLTVGKRRETVGSGRNSDAVADLFLDAPGAVVGLGCARNPPQSRGMVKRRGVRVLAFGSPYPGNAFSLDRGRKAFRVLPDRVRRFQMDLGTTVYRSVRQKTVGLTYFKRFRMEFDLAGWMPRPTSLPAGYELVPFRSGLIREHAAAKYDSFREELDANVFPCLARHDGCLRLMNEITGRSNFVPQATWLIRFVDPNQQAIPVGTIQGLNQDEWGSVQNLGITPEHRGKGLGSILLMRSAEGFKKAGLKRMHLEVTTENTGAVRLYERLGFKRAQVVYKAAEVAGVC